MIDSMRGELAPYWQRDIRESFGMIGRVTRAARKLGFHGDGSDPDAPRPQTLRDLEDANRILIEARIGQLPDSLREAAKRRAQRIVMTSTRRQARHQLAENASCDVDVNPPTRLASNDKRRKAPAKKRTAAEIRLGLPVRTAEVAT